jgi:hypothetical protein
MSAPAHAPASSHSHARPSLASRLRNRFRGCGDLPAPDGRDPFPEYDRTVVLARLNTMAAENAAEAHDGEPWYGLTEMDIPPAHDRPYVPALAPALPPVVTDLGALPLFRAAVHAMFVRQEQACGFRAPHVTWHERYALLYRARTALPVISFGIADAARQAHEEAKAALAADVQDRIGRITAPDTPPPLPDFRAAEKMGAAALPGGPLL